jgi:DNA-binding response OmpR family regulator
MKILVIEDHPTHLKLAHHVLSASGNDVSEANRGDVAFEAIKRDRPELILLDLLLPGIDGLELVVKLKGDPETRDIPIVAVTSFPEKYSRKMALEAGCDSYIVKPINTRELSEQLHAVADKQAGELKSLSSVNSNEDSNC